jgi:hypothetical protein
MSVLICNKYENINLDECFIIVQHSFELSQTNNSQQIVVQCTFAKGSLFENLMSQKFALQTKTKIEICCSIIPQKYCVKNMPCW